MSEKEITKESEKQPLTTVSVGNPIDEETITDIQIEDLEWTVTNKETWNGNLCDCINNMYPTMLCSFSCPNIYSAYLYGILTNNKTNMHLSIGIMFLLAISGYFMSNYNNKLGNLLITSSNIFVICLITFLRTSVRKHKNIPGSNCEDTFVTVFCTPCSLAQVARTINKTETICECA